MYNEFLSVAEVSEVGVSLLVVGGYCLSRVEYEAGVRGGLVVIFKSLGSAFVNVCVCAYMWVKAILFQFFFAV